MIRLLKLVDLLRYFPAGTGAVLAALAAAGLMIYNAATGQGAFDENVIATTASAVWLWWTSRKVTPLARPRDADKVPLRPVQAPSRPYGEGV